MLCSLIGVIFISKKNEVSIRKNLPYLISFSAGVFLFTSGFMTYEAYHIFESGLLVGILVLLGYIAATIISKVYPKMHHHHIDECCDTHKNGGTSILFADAFHNIADGLVIVATFAISPILGFGTAISIFIHEALQEISEFFVLKKAGFSTKKALIYNFATSSTILIGVALGFAISDSTQIQGGLLALSAGLFFYIITHDLIPHTKTDDDKPRIILKRIGFLILGLLLIAGINSATSGHNHDHGGVHDDHEYEIHDEHDQHEDEHSDEHVGENHEEDGDRNEDEHHDEH